MAQTVKITNVECGNNLAADPTNLNAVVLRISNDEDKFQQWIQTPRQGQNAPFWFQNVGSGGFLCVDDRLNHIDLLIASANKQEKWIKMDTGQTGSSCTIRLPDNTNCIKMDTALGRVKLAPLANNDNKFLWDIGPITEVKELLTVMAQTVKITNVECGNNLAADPTNLYAVVLRKSNDEDKFQQWIQTPRQGQNAPFWFQNVGSGGFLCVDHSLHHTDLLTASANEQQNWILGQTGSSCTIRLPDNTMCIKMETPLGPVKLAPLANNDNEFLWDIRPITGISSTVRVI